MLESTTNEYLVNFSTPSIRNVTIKISKWQLAKGGQGRISPWGGRAVYFVQSTELNGIGKNKRLLASNILCVRNASFDKKKSPSRLLHSKEAGNGKSFQW